MRAQVGEIQARLLQPFDRDILGGLGIACGLLRLDQQLLDGLGLQPCLAQLVAGGIDRGTGGLDAFELGLQRRIEIAGTLLLFKPARDQVLVGGGQVLQALLQRHRRTARARQPDLQLAAGLLRLLQGHPRALHQVTLLRQHLLDVGALLAQLRRHLLQGQQPAAGFLQLHHLLVARLAQAIEILLQRGLAGLGLFETYGLRLAERHLLRLPIAALVEAAAEFTALGFQHAQLLVQLAQARFMHADRLRLFLYLRLELFQQLAARDHATVFTTTRIADPVATAPDPVGIDHRAAGTQRGGARFGLSGTVGDLDRR